MINGFGKYIESGFDLECSLGFSGGLVFEVCSGLMFFKCSCGKLVLFWVFFLEGVNGDFDYNGLGRSFLLFFEDCGDLEFLELVWVKCWGYFFYFVLIIDFKMFWEGFLYNGVFIFVFLLDVLKLGE